MKKYDKLSGKLFVELTSDEIPVEIEKSYLLKQGTSNFLSSSESLLKAFSSMLIYFKIVDSGNMGFFVERFGQKRDGIQKGNKTNDGVKDGKRYEYKASTKGSEAVFKQIRLGKIDVFKCIIITGYTSYKVYELSHKQMFSEAELNGFSKTHGKTTKEFDLTGEGEYNVSFNPSWRQYEINSSSWEKEMTSVYPNLYPNDGLLLKSK